MKDKFFYICDSELKLKIDKFIFVFIFRISFQNTLAIVVKMTQQYQLSCPVHDNKPGKYFCTNNTATYVYSLMACTLL